MSNSNILILIFLLIHFAIVSAAKVNSVENISDMVFFTSMSVNI